MAGIYYIKNTINNKLYIGQSVDVNRRLSDHKRALKNGTDSKHLQKSYNSYGKESFEFVVLKVCAIDELDYWEKYYIKLWNTHDEDFGYNLDYGGSKSRLMSEETKQLMSRSRTGHTVSEETRSRISKNHKDVKGENHHRCRPICCPELNETFWGAKEVYNKYGIDTSSIAKVLNGKKKSAGKHPVTSKKLTWIYLENKCAKHNRMRFVEAKNLAMGDKNEFYVDDDSILSVMEVSGNHHDIIRQRLGAGTTTSVATKWIGIKIYSEFERVMTGADDWAKFVQKVYEAYDHYIKQTIYDTMAGYTNSIPSLYKKTGTVTKENLDALCDAVAIATGLPVMIMGTRTALSKVTALQNATYVSDSMKEEHYRTGFLGINNRIINIRYNSSRIS